VNGDPAVPSRTAWLAGVSIIVWLAAAASSGRLGLWTAIGGAAVSLGVAVLLLERPAPAVLLQPSARRVLLGAVAGAAMAAATYVLYPLTIRLAPFIATDTATLYAAFRAPSYLLASVALVPVIVGEELVWRGVVQTALVPRAGTPGSVLLAAAVYGLVHAPLGSPVLVAVAFCCGLVWGTLRATTASLVPSLVAHLLWDALVLFWWPLDLMTS
jgi:membrane protease YdiL (CAAX protease family)